MLKMTYNELMQGNEKMVEFVKNYRKDSALRAKVDSNPRKALADMGINNIPANIDLIVKANDDKTMYFTIPVNPNQELSEENLSMMNAAKGSCAGSAGSASSASTLGSFVCSISSASSLGCASSAGSAAS